VGDWSDTIFAVSSGALPSAIAVVRISGSKARFGLETFVAKMPEVRRAAMRTLRHPDSGEALDQALVLWFAGPRTATGEEMVELHLHGGRAVVAGVLGVLSSLDGFRAAEPGEFSRRAFENGKLDLTEVEGLADLIAAETEAQRRQALRQLQGRFGTVVEDWRRRLMSVRAYIEASLDFADEEDVPGDLSLGLEEKVSAVRFEIETMLSDKSDGERIRDGIQVALMGPPNAGKSSLMNAIAKRDVAIVTEEAGTTRDVLEVHLDLGGYPVTLADTAGVREAENIVEKEGIRRAVDRGRAADLVLWMQDATTAEVPVPAAVAEEAGAVWRVANKIDLLDSGSKRPDGDWQAVSVKTGAGFQALTDALGRFAAERCGSGSGMITRARHRQALGMCRDALVRAETAFDSEPELLAEEVRLACEALGRITGRVGVEDVLDLIFSEFCIGK